MAEEVVLKLLEELDIPSDDRIKLHGRWISFKQSVENYWDWAHPRYKED